MIFADEFEQACPATKLAHRHMDVSDIHGNVFGAQFLDQTLEHICAGQVDPILSAGVKDHGPGSGSVSSTIALIRSRTVRALA